MTTYNDISQNVSINCNLSITNINSRVEPTSKVSISEDNFSHSSYRKSYIVWDKLERANKPDNYTEKTKYLSKNAKALLSVVYQKLKKQMLCASHTRPPLRQVRSPLYTKYLYSFCHPPFQILV